MALNGDDGRSTRDEPPGGMTTNRSGHPIVGEHSSDRFERQRAAELSTCPKPTRRLRLRPLPTGFLVKRV
jgi:hypothetical protein